MKRPAMFLAVVSTLAALCACDGTASAPTPRAGPMNTFVNGRPAKNSPAAMLMNQSSQYGPQ